MSVWCKEWQSVWWGCGFFQATGRLGPVAIIPTCAEQGEGHTVILLSSFSVVYNSCRGISLWPNEFLFCIPKSQRRNPSGGRQGKGDQLIYRGPPGATVVLWSPTALIAAHLLLVKKETRYGENHTSEMKCTILFASKKIEDGSHWFEYNTKHVITQSAGCSDAFCGFLVQKCAKRVPEGEPGSFSHTCLTVRNATWKSSRT